MSMRFIPQGAVGCLTLHAWVCNFLNFTTRRMGHAVSSPRVPRWVPLSGCSPTIGSPPRKKSLPIRLLFA